MPQHHQSKEELSYSSQPTSIIEPIKIKPKNRSRVKYHRKSSRDPTNQKRVTGKRLKIRPPQVAGGENNSFTKTVKYFDTSRNS